MNQGTLLTALFLFQVLFLTYISGLIEGGLRAKCTIKHAHYLRNDTDVRVIGGGSGEPRAKCPKNSNNVRNVTDARIIGGFNVKNIRDFPYVVQIWTAKLGGWTLCSGALVGTNKVLTAAHCPMSTRSGNYVLFGTENLHTGGIFSKISRVDRHPGFNSNSKANDIAVITLKDHIRGLAKVIALANPGDELPGVGTVLGYGETAQPSTGWSNVLKGIPQCVIPGNMCKMYLNQYPVTSNNICTTHPTGEGACLADAGAPVVSEDCSATKRLIGIASYVIECAGGKPDVHTGVAKYYDWIRGHL